MRSYHRGSIVVAETSFVIRYEGPDINAGRIDVRDLAPSLFALGELFFEANRIVNPGGLDVALEIQATSESSFDAHLILSHINPADIVDLFSSDAATAILQFKELIIGSGIGLFALIKWLRGRSTLVEQTTGDDPSYVRVTAQDGTSIEVPSKVLDLYGSATIRRNARTVVRPLDREGIDSVEFVEDSKTTVSVGSEDVEAFDLAADDDADQGPERLLNDTVNQVALTIARVPLTNPDAPWRFDDGEREFQAAMLDEAFKQRVANHVEAFRAGDSLVSRVRLRQYQNVDTGRRRNEWSVVEVREHIEFRPVEQLSIDMPARSREDEGEEPPLSIEPPPSEPDDGDST
jgi:hypothetical protein